MKLTTVLLAKDFESASNATAEFKAFLKIFKIELAKELKSIGANIVQFKAGHFDASGFFTSSEGKLFYFNLGDVRGHNMQMLYRTAKDLKDFTGGHNQWVKIEPGMTQNMRV